MELKIKVLEIFPNIKNIKIRPSDIISLSFEAENVVVKIDNIEKSIINKDNILLLLKEFSPKQKISFNLLRNDTNILGKGKFIPLPGIKWHKIYELINRTEGNVTYNSKTLSRKNLNINNYSSDISSNSNIKVKLDIQMNMLKTPISKKSKGRIKFSPKKSYNINGNKNKSNLNGTSNIDDKYNNSLMSSNMSSNFNKYKSNRKISSYAATPGLKSPRYTSIFNREKINSMISKDNSSGDNTLKEYNFPILDNENRKKKKDSSKRTPSGKKILFDSQRYKAKYGFNKNQAYKKAKSTDKSMDNCISSDKKTRISKEIEEEILDNNFKNIIKYDENLRAKEITDFNIDNNNSINNQENDINNNDDDNNTKKSFTQKKGVTFNINNNLETNNSNINTNTSISKIKINENSNNNANSSEPINNNIKNNANSNIVNNNNDNKNNDKNINNKISNEYNNSNNELNNVNVKDDFNKIIQNSVVSSALSSNRIFNSGCDIDLSVDDLSGSFSAGYDNISKILPIDEFRKITYDIEVENISKYENIKKDFILFYNKEYINSINDEMLILELQLMIDKILEMQNVYKRQTIIIQKNFELYKKKIIFYQKRNLLMNKKKNKLAYEKLKNTYNEELNDLYYNNRKSNFYNNKNIFKTNELTLWNNLTSYINEKNSKKENEINNIKKKFNDIFILICNKNVNNLNALSKKFVLEFSEKQKEKKEMSNNSSFNSNKKKNDNINNLKYKKFNHKNNSQKDIKNNAKNNYISSLYKSNKILKVNDTFFKKKNKKDVFQIKEIATEESININNTNINNDERIKKVKFKSNELEGISNRNHLHKNGFNTAKYLKKKSSNKKGK